jgi:hypothetical protein
MDHTGLKRLRQAEKIAKHAREQAAAGSGSATPGNAIVAFP